jgi:hypothetical protein
VTGHGPKPPPLIAAISLGARQAYIRAAQIESRFPIQTLSHGSAFLVCYDAGPGMGEKARELLIIDKRPWMLQSDLDHLILQLAHVFTKVQSHRVRWQG